MTVHLRIHCDGDAGIGMIAGVYPEIFQFPGGEWHLRNIPEIKLEWGKVTYIASVHGADPNDLVKAALWRDVASKLNFTSPQRKDADFVLVLPYLPAARADRGVPLGAMVYAKFIRCMSPTKILTIDPHSSFMPRLFRNLQVVEHDSLIAEAFDGVNLDGVICPDDGAKSRAESAALFLGLDVYYATKHRDFATGALSGFEAPKDLPKSGRYLIVDDICDGGGTFKGLASALGLGRDQLALWVTHGIFSGKAEELRSSYRWIATTDSHPGHNRPGVATCIIPAFAHMISYL